MTAAQAALPRVGHVPALDGIRGVGVALVVVHHVVVRDDDPLLLGGWLGVDLFFVLSGYLITASMIGSPDLGRFYSRRYWRLAPAMFVLLSTYTVATILGGATRQRAEWALAATTQWANIQGAIGPPFSPHLGHIWSLSAEAQFYVLWGLALWWLLRRGVGAPAIAGLLVVLFVASAIERAALWEAGAMWNRLYLGPDTHSAPLVAGCLVGVAHTSGWLRAPRTLAVASIPAAVLFGWAVVELLFLDGRVYRWGLTAIAAAGAVIVAGAAIGAPSPLRPVLELAPLRVLGRISYSVYLWHLPIIEEVARRRPADDITGVAAIAIPLSVVVGALSYAAIERPFLSSAGRARLRARFGG